MEGSPSKTLLYPNLCLYSDAQVVLQYLPVLLLYTRNSLPQFKHLAVGTLMTPLLNVSDSLIFLRCGNSIPNLNATF